MDDTETVRATGATEQVGAQDQVELVERQPQPAAVVRGHAEVDAIPRFLSGAYEETARALAAQGQHPAGPPFACYVREGTGFAVTAGFPAEREVRPSGPVEAETLPGGPAASLLHQGDYANLGPAYERLERWVTEQGYVATSPPWESYLDTPDVARPRTVLLLPCARPPAA